MAATTKFTNFKTHRPYDRTDLGFEIPGYKLRWISARAAENSPGRIWNLVRKRDLPPKLIEHIENYSPAAFSGEGETIRRGELVLGYASIEAAKVKRQELKELSRAQEGLLADRPAGVKHVRRVESDVQDVTLDFDAGEVKEESGSARFDK